MKLLIITEITKDNRRAIYDAERVELHAENKITVIKDRNSPLAQPNDEAQRRRDREASSATET